MQTTILAEMEKKIRQIYHDASVDLNKKIQIVLKEFKRDDERYKAELSEDDYKKWRKSEAARIASMRDLQKQLAETVVNADKVAAEIINGHLPLIYSEEYNYGTYQIEGIGQVNTSFTLYDHDTVERLLLENPDLLPQVNIDVPKDLRWSKKHITSAITQGIIQGESIPDIAKRLQKTVGMNERAAIRNARTATTGAENAGRIDSYHRAQSMGIAIKKKWLSTFDSRTRHSHVLLDGETVEVDELFSNGVRFPGDPEGNPSEVYNCRCTLVPVIKGHERDDSWKNEMNINGLSYDKWKEAHRNEIHKSKKRRDKR